MTQFTLNFSKEKVSFNNDTVLYFPNFFDRSYLDTLSTELEWRSDKIQMFGNIYPLPRLQCWYGDEGIHYSYSGISITRNEWTLPLEEILSKIHDEFPHRFNGMLGNYYRGGDDQVSWHSDDEEALGSEPAIACASFGETRIFSLRNKETKESFQIRLEDRSLLLMLHPTQRDWEHQINKSKSLKGPRISLTFRFVHQ